MRNRPVAQPLRATQTKRWECVHGVAWWCSVHWLWGAAAESVKTFSPAEDPFGPRDALDELTVVGSQLFFVVGETASGNELWTSDGTSEGTRQVKDLTPGAEGSFLSGLTATGSTLLFFRYLPETAASPEHKTPRPMPGEGIGAGDRQLSCTC